MFLASQIFWDRHCTFGLAIRFICCLLGILHSQFWGTLPAISGFSFEIWVQATMRPQFLYFLKCKTRTLWVTSRCASSSSNSLPCLWMPGMLIVGTASLIGSTEAKHLLLWQNLLHGLQPWVLGVWHHWIFRDPTKVFPLLFQHKVLNSLVVLISSAATHF